MKKYILKYLCIHNQIDKMFVSNADCIASAVKDFVKHLQDNDLPSDIEFMQVSEDDNDLGIDGVLEAEKALAEFYD